MSDARTFPNRQLAFGPVPSRRLGHSLGINNVPRKQCTCSCIYCQLGPTSVPNPQRRVFQEPNRLVDAVATRVERLRARGEPIDYVTFASCANSRPMRIEG